NKNCIAKYDWLLHHKEANCKKPLHVPKLKFSKQQNTVTIKLSPIIMACNSSNCKSNCYKDPEEEEEEQDPPSSPTLSNNNNTKTTKTNQNLCIKCKTNQPTCGGSGSDDGDGGRLFCADCFRTNLYGKFRLAVTSHAMITPDDNVLVAFSGGPSSRVALQFIHEMQYRAQKNFDASRDRSLPVFRVGVAFISESSINPILSDKEDRAIEEMRSIVSNLAPPPKQFHVVPIESIYSSDSSDARDSLKELLAGVSDTTGKEDLMLHLRMLSLQKIASENGYNRLALGSCTSRIACHVLSATVKLSCLYSLQQGQGYSLPADIQYVDARWEIPIVLPLRDCLAQELSTLCHLNGLKTVEVRNGPCSGINGLISSFVTLLQEENPSRECTIVRTAGKLTPFHFNRIPEIDGCNVSLAARKRQKKFNLKANEPISSETFCPICNSPLNQSDLQSMKGLPNSQTSIDAFGATCCSSCRFQILPKEPTSMESLYALLPHPLVARAKQGIYGNMSSLREQIQDCLLSDSEGET
ncbi:DUF2392 domain-containing protein, partial [Cephalotus follicularis]